MCSYVPYTTQRQTTQTKELFGDAIRKAVGSNQYCSYYYTMHHSSFQATLEMQLDGTTKPPVITGTICHCYMVCDFSAENPLRFTNDM